MNFKKIFIKIIQIIHLTLIIYIILGPFLFPNRISEIITILLFILYRWITNDNSCTLTTIENILSGNKNGFIYRIVNPIYKLREQKFNKILYLITFIWLFFLIKRYKENK